MKIDTMKKLKTLDMPRDEITEERISQFKCDEKTHIAIKAFF